jgi:hypothetical protein
MPTCEHDRRAAAFRLLALCVFCWTSLALAPGPALANTISLPVAPEAVQELTVQVTYAASTKDGTYAVVYANTPRVPCSSKPKSPGGPWLSRATVNALPDGRWMSCAWADPLGDSGLYPQATTNLLLNLASAPKRKHTRYALDKRPATATEFAAIDRYFAGIDSSLRPRAAGRRKRARNGALQRRTKAMRVSRAVRQQRS